MIFAKKHILSNNFNNILSYTSIVFNDDNIVAYLYYNTDVRVLVNIYSRTV